MAQLLTESVLIALLGGAVGIALAYSAANALVAMLDSGTAVVQRRCRARFLLGPLDVVCSCHFRRQNSDGDRAIPPRIMGTIDFAHAAGQISEPSTYGPSRQPGRQRHGVADDGTLQRYNGGVPSQMNRRAWGKWRGREFFRPPWPRIN